MKIGDLVKNGQGHMGIVTALGYSGEFSSIVDCPFRNPDIHVVTSSGKRLWIYNALEIISEKRLTSPQKNDYIGAQKNE